MPQINAPLDLLARPAQSLGQATITVAGSTVTIAGPADVLQRHDGTISYVFAAQGNALALSTSAHAQQVTLAALVDGGWISAVSGFDDAVFSAVTLDHAADAPSIAVAGTLAQPVALGAVTIDSVLAQVSIVGGVASAGIASFTGKLGAAEQLAVRADPPIPYAGWRVSSVPSATAPAADAAALLNDITQTSWASLVPSLLPAAIRLTGFDAEYADDHRPLAIGGRIAADGEWTLIPGALALTAFYLDFTADAALAPLIALTGEIGGTVNLFGADIGARIPLSGDALLLTCEPHVSLPALGEISGGIASLLHVPLPMDLLPAPIRNFGGFSVDRLTAALDLTGGAWTLRSLGLRLGMPEPADPDPLPAQPDPGPTGTDTSPAGGAPAPVPDRTDPAPAGSSAAPVTGDSVPAAPPPPPVELIPGIVITDFVAEVAVDDPLGAAEIGLTVDVDTMVGDTELSLHLARAPGASIWEIGLAAPGTLTLAAVPRLLGWSGDLASLLPGPLEGAAGLGLDSIDLSYDFDAGEVVSSLVRGSLAESWAIVGDTLVLNELELAVAMNRTAPVPPATEDTLELEMSIRSQWTLGTASFAVAAERGSDTGWGLSIQLAPDSSIGLGDLVAAVAPGSQAVPSFLPAIDITGLGLAIDLGSGAITFNLRTEAVWAPAVAGKTGSCAGFDLMLSLGAVPATPAPDGTAFGGRPYSLAFDGTLSFAGLPTIQITASTTSALAFVEVAGIVGDVGGQTDASGWARSLVGADWTSDTGGASALAVPTMSAAGAYLRIPKDPNASGGLLLLAGSLAGVGTAALLVARYPRAPETPTPGTLSSTAPAPAEFDWGYAFLLEARPDFTFATLDSRLAVIDGLISLTGVGVAVANFDAVQANVADSSGLPIGAALGAARDDLASVDIVTAVPSTAPPPFERGLNVHGELVFRGPLWEALSAVLDLRGATLNLRARVDPSDPTATLFQGELEDFTLLSLVRFTSLKIQYRPRAEGVPAPTTPATPVPSLVVDGDGAVRVGSTSLPFHGIVTFTTGAAGTEQTADAAAFQGTLLASADIVDPLGIPHVTLHPARLSGAWVKRDAGWTRTSFQLDASVTICGLTLSAALDMAEDDRQRVAITLAAADRLSLQNLIVNGLGAQWADGLVPDLSFSDGSLVYVSFTDTTKPTTYTLHARASIFGLGFLFDVELTSGTGVIGTATLENAADFGLLRLAGPQGIAGPQANLSNTSTSTQMSLQTRVTLLDHDFDFTLTYASTAGRSAYSGTISTQIDLGAIGSITPTVVVTYDEDGQTDVQLKDFGLPIKQLKQVFDVIESIENFRGPSGECPSIGNLLDGAIDADVKVGLAFPKLAPGSGPTTIRIGLNITCTISLKAPVNYDWSDTIELSFLDIQVPEGGLTFGNVITALLEALPGALPNLISSFFSDPEAMAKLSALAAAKAVLNAVTDALLCHSTPPGGGGGGEGGGGGGGADPRAAYVAGFVVAAGIVAFLVSIWDALTGEEKKRKERAEEQQRANAHALANFAKPSQVALRYLGHDGVEVAWIVDASQLRDNEGGTYVVALTRRGGDGQVDWTGNASVQWRKKEAPPLATIRDPAILAGSTYHALVFADVTLTNLAMPNATGDQVGIAPYVAQDMGGGMGGMFDVRAQSDAADGADMTIPDFVARGVTIEEIGAEIEVSFMPGPAAADHYEFGWTDGTGAPLAGAVDPSRQFTPTAQSQPPYRVRLDRPAEGDRLAVRVLALLAAPPDRTSQATSSPALDLARLTAPPLAAPAFDLATVTVPLAWGPVEGATGYRVQGAAATEGATADSADLAAGILTGSLDATAWIGLAGRLRVGAIGAGGKGVTWSEWQSIDVPGALVTVTLPAPAQGQSADGLAISVRSLVPGAAALSVSPGESKALGARPIAAFTAERSSLLTQQTSQLSRYSYTLTALFPSLALQAPLSGEWPQPPGVTLATEWAIVPAGGTAVRADGVSPIVLQSRIQEGVAPADERVAIALAVDLLLPEAAQRDALVALARDTEATALALHPDGATTALEARFAAVDQPLDCIVLARLLLQARPALAPADFADAITTVAADGLDPAVLFAAYRAGGFDVRECVAQLHRTQPLLGATAIAVAAVQALYSDAALRSYATALAATGLQTAVLGTRLARSVGTGAAETPALLAALYRARGLGVRAAAIALRQALPSLGATDLAIALVAANYDPSSPKGLVAAATAVANALRNAAPQRLAWALSAAGVPDETLAMALAAAVDLPGSAAAAAAATVVPRGAAALRAGLSAGTGSPFTAVNAAKAALSGVAASAQLAMIAAVFPGMAARPDLLTAALAIAGASEAEATAALDLMLTLDATAAAAAWSAGQALLPGLL